MTASKCRRSHRPLYWMMGTLLAITAGTGLMIGVDFSSSTRASDAAAEVKTELRVHRAIVEERDKAVEGKLHTFQNELDKRFDNVQRSLDRINDKLDNGHSSSIKSGPHPDHEASNP